MSVMSLAKRFRQSSEPGTYSCILIAFASPRCVGSAVNFLYLSRIEVFVVELAKWYSAGCGGREERLNREKGLEVTRIPKEAPRRKKSNVIMIHFQDRVQV